MVAVWRCGHHSGTIRASRWDKSGTPFLDRDLRGPFAAGTVNVGRFWGSSDVEEDVSMQTHILSHTYKLLVRVYFITHFSIIILLLPNY